MKLQEMVKYDLKKKVRLGILGGTFDPAHKGHLKISRVAKKLFKLEKVVWAITKKNPFKNKSFYSLNKRIQIAKNLTSKTKYVNVGYYEKKIKSNKTIKLINFFKKNHRNEIFLIMGADNLINFHKWEKWTWIMENIPVGVMARPGDTIRAGLSLTALRYQKFRVKSSYAGLMPFMNPPVWSLLGGPTRDVSSTQIRCNVKRK